jgi:nicotinamide mononucleotide transporter
MVATYAMARGWNDFWLAWVAVDLVGVPLLWHSTYYPSAILYVFYGALCVVGFVAWLRATRAERSGAVAPGARGSASAAEEVRA